MSDTSLTLISPGAMGSAVAARLAEKGATVLTSLEGRGPASRARAAAAAMIEAPMARLAASGVILSIVPPAVAEQAVQPFLPYLAEGQIWVDCNALSPAVKRRLGEAVAAFLGEDEAGALIFEGMARLYERMARGDSADRAALDAFFG